MNNIKGRILFIFFGFILLYSIVVGRLFYLQIIKHDFFKVISLEQRLKIVNLSPDRGDIYDRNGSLLATTIDSYSVYAIPSSTVRAA